VTVAQGDVRDLLAPANAYDATFRFGGPLSPVLDVTDR
jgi:hypothetical protein